MLHGLRAALRGLSLRGLLGQQALLAATRWGFSKSLGALLLKFTASRAAVGVVTVGATSLTVRHQLEEAKRRAGLERDVLAAGDELAWINAAARPIWEHLDAGLRKLIREEIEPILQQRIPKPLGRYLHFERLTLGEAAPRLGPVTVTRSPHGVDFNIGFSFAGDAAIVFSYGIGTLEVVDLRIDGAFQVALRPLVDAPNPCGGVTVSCLDRPSIDLTIRAGSGLAPNLYDLVREAVDDVVAGLVVVPNGIAVAIPTLGPVTDWPALRYPAPRGILRLTLQEAISGSEEPMSAPYVVAQIGAATWHSPAATSASSSSGPLESLAWGAGGTQDFTVFSPNQCVELRVFQAAAALGQDSLLGRARIEVHVIAEGGELEVPLHDASGEPCGRQLRLKGEWLAVSEEPPPPPEPGSQPAAGADAAGAAVAMVMTRSVARGSRWAPAATPGQGEAEVLVSVRVDEVSGLPPDASCRYILRARAGGGAEASHAGYAPYTLTDEISDEAFISLARKLAPRLTLADLAHALEITPERAREMAEHLGAVAAKKQPVDTKRTEAWELEWCRSAREEARRLAASSTPRFDKIFHLPARRLSRLEVELVCRRDGTSAERTVAALVRDLGDVACAGGTLEGPFQLPLGATGGGGECTLQGSIRLRRLEPDSEQARASDLGNFLDPLGLSELARPQGREGR